MSIKKSVHDQEHQLLPVGSRPCCFRCGKELKPHFEYDEEKPRLSEVGSLDALKQWEKEHKVFAGTYGLLHGGKFCTYLCAARWANKYARI